MKRLKLLFALLYITVSFVSAEGYRPMLKDGKEWHEESITGSGNLDESIITLRGTTFLGGKEYSNLYVKHIVYNAVGFENGKGIVYSEEGEESEESLCAYLREESGKVFVNRDGKETMLYDFTLMTSDSCSFSDVRKMVVDSIGGLVFGKNTFKHMFITEMDMEMYEKIELDGFIPEDYPQYWSKSGSWIEGIGSCFGLLQSSGWVTTPGLPHLTKCYEDGQLIYSDSNAAIHQTSSVRNTNKAESVFNCQLLFDLQGRRINGVPSHGIYIRNGKKFVKK